MEYKEYLEKFNNEYEKAKRKDNSSEIQTFFLNDTQIDLDSAISILSVNPSDKQIESIIKSFERFSI